MFLRIFIVLAFFLTGAAASASSYEISNVSVQIEADNAVKAKDNAIPLAQRQAFMVLVGKTVEETKDITDVEIARLVSGFSVKNEKLGARSYSAIFTVRFEPNRTQYFIQSKGYDIIDPATLTGETAGGIRANPAQDMLESGALVLPVLDIGTRRVLWDEPNPWREVWQKKDYSIKGMNLRVPLGDVTDIQDIPDAQFLTGAPADVGNMLRRYGVNTIYIALIKNQGAALDPSGGMTVSLYAHNGNKLSFVKKTILHPRAGYAFDDAVPAVVQMMADVRNNKDTDEEPETELAAEEPKEEPTGNNIIFDESVLNGAEPAAVQGSVIVTVPYQSLGQWVGIQKRLRQVDGVLNILPIRVSPSSAQIELVTNVPQDTFAQNAALAGFEMQAMPNGELALIER
jgi:hypothetical protein